MDLIERLIEATKLLVGAGLAVLSFAWLTLGTFVIICFAFIKTPLCLFAFMVHPVVVAYLLWLLERDWL